MRCTNTGWTELISPVSAAWVPSGHSTFPTRHRSPLYGLRSMGCSISLATRQSIYFGPHRPWGFRRRRDSHESWPAIQDAASPSDLRARWESRTPVCSETRSDRLRGGRPKHQDRSRGGGGRRASRWTLQELPWWQSRIRWLSTDVRESQIALHPDSLWAVIHDGVLIQNGMPRFDSITHEQMMQLFAFIRAQARKALVQNATEAKPGTE